MARNSFNPLNKIEDKEIKSIEDKLDFENDFAISNEMPTYWKQFNLCKNERKAKKSNRKRLSKYRDNFIKVFKKNTYSEIEVSENSSRSTIRSRPIKVLGYGELTQETIKEIDYHFIAGIGDMDSKDLQGQLNIRPLENKVKISIACKLKEYTNSEMKIFKKLTRALDEFGKNYGKK